MHVHVYNVCVHMDIWKIGKVKASFSFYKDMKLYISSDLRQRKKNGQGSCY